MFEGRNMTEINQNSLASHHSVDEASRHSGDTNPGNGAHGRQLLDDSTRDLKYEATSGSVNISFNAHMRLRAYQDQKTQSISGSKVMTQLNSSMDGLSGGIANQSSDTMDFDSLNKDSDTIKSDKKNNENATLLNKSVMSDFSERISGMLSEVHNNIVQDSEPGYRYLVNMLNNYRSEVEDPQELQEIMRKEEFYLARRKPFMASADFQSYSQVLNQFSNIVERQQYA